ncbi:hypothetical protein [Lacticaseibacillus absianus]|uniref:hypothetical protein n=1 Tax=Lacticaseibacillus absianus TaxID=2729623 RepID=UPI0015CC5077|nr:hypothetical protein [Lacticaseibacillus absianus]
MTDKRTLKTLAAIDATGYDLLATVGFDQLSVQAWCTAAHITRPTFYGYYLDKGDWLERQIDVALRQLTPALDAAPVDWPVALTRAAWARRVPLRILLQVHATKLDLTAALTALLVTTLRPQLSGPTAAYRASAAASACVHDLVWLLTEGRNVQVEAQQRERLAALIDAS